MGRCGHGAWRKTGLVIDSVGLDLQVADPLAIAGFFPHHEVSQAHRPFSLISGTPKVASSKSQTGNFSDVPHQFTEVRQLPTQNKTTQKPGHVTKFQCFAYDGYIVGAAYLRCRPSHLERK
jgi:hypothetical protein